MILEKVILCLFQVLVTIESLNFLNKAENIFWWQQVWV